MCAEDGPPLSLVCPLLRDIRPTWLLFPRRAVTMTVTRLLKVARTNLCPSVRVQGEQLRRILQLQVLHPLPGLLAGVLSVHRSHRAAVFHKVLDSE